MPGTITTESDGTQGWNKEVRQKKNYLGKKKKKKKERKRKSRMSQRDKKDLFRNEKTGQGYGTELGKKKRK